ncbi:hypothetical protein Ancab_025259 [Ancistrocladus abbreviatus]
MASVSEEMAGDHIFVNYNRGPQMKTTTRSNYYPLSEASEPNLEQGLQECLPEKLENVNKDENSKTSSEATRPRMSASQRYTSNELALNGKSLEISNSLHCADKARSPMIIPKNKETSTCRIQNNGNKVELSLVGPRKPNELNATAAKGAAVAGHCETTSRTDGSGSTSKISKAHSKQASRKLPKWATNHGLLGKASPGRK